MLPKRIIFDDSQKKISEEQDNKVIFRTEDKSEEKCLNSLEMKIKDN